MRYTKCGNLKLRTYVLGYEDYPITATTIEENRKRYDYLLLWAKDQVKVDIKEDLSFSGKLATDRSKSLSCVDIAILICEGEINSTVAISLYDCGYFDGEIKGA
jgi:hypothetical protein